jgi:hypothetical protein
MSGPATGHRRTFPESDAAPISDNALYVWVGDEGLCIEIETHAPGADRR